MAEHGTGCVCSGRGTVETGPAGATYSMPCPGPPRSIVAYGVPYIRTDATCVGCGRMLKHQCCDVCDPDF